MIGFLERNYLGIVLSEFIIVNLFYFLAIFYNPSREKIINICKDKKKFSRFVWFLLFFHFLLAFLLRKQVPDVALFESAGWWLRKKVDTYFIDSSHGTYPFFPFLIFPYALANYISEKFPLLIFSFLIKIFLIPTIYALGVLIEKQLLSTGETTAKSRYLRFLFLVNPIVFYTVIFHGQADILLIFFLVLSILIFTKEKSFLSRFYSGIFYGLSILTKTWSIIFLPLLAINLKKLKSLAVFFASTFLTILLVSFLYTRLVGSRLLLIFRIVTGYSGGAPGWWGITLFLPPLSWARNFILAAVLFLLYIYIWGKKANIFKVAKILILGIYCFVGGWGLQYSLWVVPFAFLDKDFASLKKYTILMSVYLFFSYSQLSSPTVSKFLSLPGWLFCIYWLLDKIRS